MKKWIALLLVAVILFPGRIISAGEARDLEMQEALVLRIEDIGALDAADSDLSLFLSPIRRDAANAPFLTSLIGPMLHNPYFTGLAADAWLEGVLAIPVKPGPLVWVWVFPVDSQDEYLSGLLRLGMSDAEGVDDVSVLSRVDPDGNIERSYLDWLPGNIAVFGNDRDGVRAVREIYQLAGARRGLLGARKGRELSPDISLRFLPSRFATWQSDEAGVYWWRSQVRRLAAELIEYWEMDSARGRFVTSMAEDLADLPMAWSNTELRLWMDEKTIEWRLALTGGSDRAGPLSQLSSIRRMPEGVSEAYAYALNQELFESLANLAGRLLLGAAGGVVPSGAREAAESFARMLSQAGPRQAAISWLPINPETPRLGSSRILAAEWDRPEVLDAAWLVFLAAAQSDGPVAAAMTQMGAVLSLDLSSTIPGACTLTVKPRTKENTKPYFAASMVARRQNQWLSLVWGEVGQDQELQRQILEHRAQLADAVLQDGLDGTPDVRQAFTLMGQSGASFIMTLSPVRFLQTLLAEAADWRILTPDEEEPLSTRHAQEMFEFRDAGGAWCAVGTEEAGKREIIGRISWDSLKALAAALGLSENLAITPEAEEPLVR